MKTITRKSKTKPPIDYTKELAKQKYAIVNQFTSYNCMNVIEDYKDATKNGNSEAAFRALFFMLVIGGYGATSWRMDLDELVDVCCRDLGFAYTYGTLIEPAYCPKIEALMKKDKKLKEMYSFHIEEYRSV